MPYETQPGTIPHAIVERLRTLGPGMEITCQQCAIIGGLPNASGLRTLLGPAIKAGVLAVRVATPRQSWYRLGDGTELHDTEGDPQITQIDAAAVPSIWAYAEQRQAADFATFTGSDGRLILQRRGRVIAELTPDEAKVHREYLERRGAWEMQE